MSLLSVWVLVGLFFYLNHYTKRNYFAVWTVAWLFYALWLTAGLTLSKILSDDVVFIIRQCCVAVSAVFLLWGTARFLSLPARQSLFGLFMLFLMSWTIAGTKVFSIKKEALQIQLPVFILIGLSSVFAAVSFYRVRKKMPFVGAGMLALGFFLWGVYLGSYPFSEHDRNLYFAGFLVASVLQLFIAVSMIVLVLEEARYNAEQIQLEMSRIRSEKEELQLKILTVEEESRALYDRVRMSEGIQKAYDELRHTQDAVVRQERLRAIGQMASGVAHDINNALSPVLGYSELLLTTMTELPEKAREYLQTINQSANDIAQIISRMREFYRSSSNTEKFSKVHLNHIVREVVKLTRPRWRDVSQREGVSIDIQCQLEVNLPALLSDPSELREALTNIVFNSIDAMPQGGVITIVTRSVPVADNSGKPTHLCLELRDTGIGMDEKVRERCFEPFFSTKTKTGGSGLGLAMVYGFMQRQNGSIKIDSIPGSGTTIRLLFPILRKNPADTASAIKTVARRSLRILCIDDEETIRQILKDSLTSFKHHVTVAADGNEGLTLFDKASRNQHPFDAVITDLGMPGIDGLHVAKIVKKNHPHVPVIMLTGWGTMMKQDHEDVSEVDALLGKPPRIKELNELLLRLTTPKSQLSLPLPARPQ
ncbi:MAG TPA: ATP-binding protein [Verrucomicrobiae bacterium]|nr:ATP-binding protein [Verrucomicrobiae bacterium]